MEPKLCGMAIQKWRRRRKMTQVELSDATGIPLRTLQNYEAGVLPKKFPIDRVKKLTEALRCEPLALIVPEWKQLYEGILLEVQEVLLAADSALEKSVEVTRASRELRNWQIFFNALDEDVPTEPPTEAQKQLEESVAFMPEGADPINDENTEE